VIFVDTSVLLDLVTKDSVWVSWSEDVLSWASDRDKLAIDDAVYAELSVKFDSIALLDGMIASFKLEHLQMPKEALFLAGKAHLRYRRKGGPRLGVLSDFFIGAHALVEKAPLITRDTRRIRTYFPALDLIAPDR